MLRADFTRISSHIYFQDKNNSSFCKQNSAWQRIFTEKKLITMKRIKIFISSVQREFAEERAMLCHYIRTDVLLGKFFEPFYLKKFQPMNILLTKFI